MKIVWIAGLAVAMSSAAWAQTTIYKHVDENGRVTYTNKPMKGATVLELDPITTIPATPALEPTRLARLWLSLHGAGRDAIRRARAAQHRRAHARRRAHSDLRQSRSRNALRTGAKADGRRALRHGAAGQRGVHASARARARNAGGLQRQRPAARTRRLSAPPAFRHHPGRDGRGA